MAEFRISGELADWSPEERTRRIARAFDIILKDKRQERQEGDREQRRT